MQEATLVNAMCTCNGTSLIARSDAGEYNVYL